VTDSFSAAIWRERIRELQSLSERDTKHLTQLATLLARADKRSRWLQRHYRAQRRQTTESTHGLGLARCYLAEATIREGVASWVDLHRVDVRTEASTRQLQDMIATLVRSMIKEIETLLTPQDDDLTEMTTRLCWRLLEAQEEPAPEDPSHE
jgi:hypothetical protein